MPKRKLTETFVVRVVASKRTYYWDSQLPGFGVRVSGGTANRKTWIVRYRMSSRKQRELKLGTFPSIGAAEARRQAMEHLRAVSAGGDPALLGAEPRAVQTMTVAKLCERFESVRMTRMTNKTVRMYRSMMTNHVLHPKYGIADLPVAAVRREHIQALVDSIAQQVGPKGLRKIGQAKKVKGLVATLFTFAEEEELRERGTSPLLGVRIDEMRREWELPLVEEVGHVFEPGESEKIWATLDELGLYEGVTDAIRLIMLTGVRVDEARLLVWNDVRLEGDPHLALRRHKTRNRKPVKTVPLSSMAVDILRRRGPGLPQAYVFPSVLDAGRPISALWPSWAKLRKEVGLPKARLHDLRGLAARHLLDAGWSKEQVQVYMQWQTPQMVELYVRGSKSSRREGAEVLAWGIAGGGAECR